MESFDPAELPELLKLYYRRLFPYAQYYRWLNYGGVVKNYFQHREFSFTLKDDIYIRYQSFNNQNDLEKEMQKMNPYKIDIGAVYTHRPSQHNTVKLGAFQAQEKELVFDIDMTDYDDVRRCCSSADICSKCWTLMTMAILIIDRALKEDFGFKHRLWVYSGRRGVHCWVCDESVRKLSSTVRSGIVEYLSLVKGGQDVKKKVHLSEKVHPFVRRSINIIKKYFEEYALVGQDILENKESWDKILALVPEAIHADLQQGFQKCHSSLQRWEHLKKTIARHQNNTKNDKCAPWLEWEIMLQYCFPRLDINVSKGINHLLKSPFSVHPKTGRISVPINLQKVDQFDPFTVPTISSICHELDAISNNEEEKEENEAESDIKRRTRDLKAKDREPALWRSGLMPWPEAPASHMGASSRHGCSTSNPVLCYGLGKQWKMVQVLGPLHPCGRPRGSSWLLTLDQHSSGCCGQLGSEPSNGRPFSLCLCSLCVTLTFK